MFPFEHNDSAGLPLNSSERKDRGDPVLVRIGFPVAAGTESVFVRSQLFEPATVEQVLDTGQVLPSSRIEYR